MAEDVEQRSNAGVVLVGLAAVLGLGLWVRSRRPQKAGPEVLEDAVYRGFAYRIEDASEGLVGVLPVQTVGEVEIATELRQPQANLVEARKWIQRAVDERLGPSIRATFRAHPVGGA